MRHNERLVLIANEDDDSCLIYSEFLKTRGYEVLIATGAENVHRIAARHRPDVIVTDFLERSAAGWRTPEILKGDRETAEIPLIAVTAWAMPDDQQRAMQSGCDVFLPKPVGPEELAKTIRAVLADDATV